MVRPAVALFLLSAVVLAGPAPPAKGAATGQVVSNQAGDLVIRGTSRSEGILLDASDLAEVIVTYDADTTDPANPVDTEVFTGAIQSLRGDLGAGSDQVEIRGLDLAGELELDLGPGADEVLFVGVSTAEDLWLTAGSGNDRLWLFDVAIGRRYSASLGFGDDLVVFAGGTVSDRTTVTGSRGSDQLNLSEVRLSGLLSFIGGPGDDELRLFLSTTGGVRFIGEEGDDVADVADTEVGAPAWFVGNAGADRFTSSGTTTFAVPPKLLGLP